MRPNATVRAWGRPHGLGSGWLETGRARYPTDTSVAREAIRYGFKIRIVPKRLVGGPRTATGPRVELIELLEYGSPGARDPFPLHQEIHLTSAERRVPHFERLARVVAADRVALRVHTDPLEAVVRHLQDGEPLGLAWAVAHGVDGDPLDAAWRTSRRPHLAVELACMLGYCELRYVESQTLNAVCDVIGLRRGRRPLRVNALRSFDAQGAERVRAWIGATPTMATLDAARVARSRS